MPLLFWTKDETTPPHLRHDGVGTSSTCPAQPRLAIAKTPHGETKRYRYRYPPNLSWGAF
eukprot:5071631-Pyramimonas_sp.AAC.2